MTTRTGLLLTRAQRAGVLVAALLGLGAGSALAEVSWRPPTCSGATFSGCALTGQPTCSDWGSGNYANWDNALWNQCQAACQYGTPNNWCQWIPPSCNGTTFMGCQQPGQPLCTDGGSAAYSNWTQADATRCENACSTGNPDSYCQWMPAKVTAHELSGCAQPGQPTCSDWGNAAYPNWNTNKYNECQTDCSSSCPAANPWDNNPDDAALQACLNQGGTVQLAPGYPGYIIDNTLVISQDNTVLTSTDSPARARLVADQQLYGPVLYASGRSNVNISWIEVDGNRPNRYIGVLPTYEFCNDPTGNDTTRSNINLGDMTGGSFKHSRSTRTVCGSSFVFNGSGMEVADNLFDNNGHGREDPLTAQYHSGWSDGITTGSCMGDSIHDNFVTDATDVGIVDGGGANCWIVNNTIIQLNRHAFAGLQAGDFGREANGVDPGTAIDTNTIKGNGLESFGLCVSATPWDSSAIVSGPNVQNNTVGGALVNLLVEGVVGGATITQNTILAPAGPTPLCGFTVPVPYVASDYDTSVTIQPGSVWGEYRGCIP
jgi:hypothetical protein